jgi:hypothetical protein
MLKIQKDAKGRVVPATHLFGIDYGSEVDDYLTPQSDEQYSKMAEESKEIIRLTLEQTGFKNWDACKFGYRIEKLRDELQDMAQEKKYGRIKFQNADRLLEILIKDLKLIPVKRRFSLEKWGQKAIDILNSFRLAREKKLSMIRKYKLDL